jgi:hypothetical protein
MQDPILMPPRNWEQPRDPERSNQRANNQRPRNVKGFANDGGLKQAHLSKPTVSDIVSTTRAQELKCERVNQTLDRGLEEAGLEQTRYEEGNFEGRWCHPVRSRSILDRPSADGVIRPSAYLTDEPLHRRAGNWMEQDLTECGEAALLACRILAGITHALQTRHSTLPRLFWAYGSHVSSMDGRSNMVSNIWLSDTPETYR